uniref:Uncharacterized protein n=1 Tax=Strigamia maritima TaxID=126957 RepID=T1J9Z8_STRMM
MSTKLVICTTKTDHILYFHNCLKEEHNISQKETLKVMFNQLVPHLSLQDSEEKLFNKISEWLKNLFRSSFELIKKHLTNNILACCDLIKPIIEELCFIMDCFACYIEKLFTNQKEVYIRHVSSLCTVTLFIVFSSYAHCKRSVEIYGRFLGTMNESLNLLFNKTGDLLTKLNILLHNILVQSSSDLHFVLSILDGLKQIGEIVFDIDIRMMASVWRLYLKIAIEQEDLIKQVLEIGPTIEVLITQLLNRLDKLQHIKTNDEVTFFKLVRMCGFLLKVIVLLCDKYGSHLGTCQKNLCSLILFMYKISPPSLTAVSSTQNLNHEVNQQLTIGLEPLIEKLIQDYNFLCLVLEEYPSADSSGFERCLLLLSILEKLPKLKKREFDEWMSKISGDKPSSILSAIFNILQPCHVELTLPVYLSVETFLGKGRPAVTLYEYIYTKLCRFIACLPARHFYYLEKVLITNLLSPNFWNRQMAMDVWSFLGRYCSPNLCFHHCCILSSVVSFLCTSTSEVAAHVECLWNRLIHFLSNDHLDQFLKSNSKLITSEIRISRISPACLIYPVKTLYEKSLSTLSVFIKSPSDVGEVDLLSSFRIAYKILQADRVHLTNDDMEKVTSLTRIIASLHKPRHLNSLLKITNSAVMEQFLLLTGELIHSFTIDEISHMLNSLDIVNKSLNSTTRMYASKCLKNLKKVENAPLIANQTLELISKLFTMLLQDSHWIVLDSALRAFTSFAHESVLTMVISKTTTNNVLVQERVTAYLNQIPWKCETDVISFLKREKITMSKDNNRSCQNVFEA